MKRGGGDESSASASILVDGNGVRTTNVAEKNTIHVAASKDGGGGGGGGGSSDDMIFTPGRVVVDKNDHLVRSGMAPPFD